MMSFTGRREPDTMIWSYDASQMIRSDQKSQKWTCRHEHTNLKLNRAMAKRGLLQALGYIGYDPQHGTEKIDLAEIPDANYILQMVANVRGSKMEKKALTSRGRCIDQLKILVLHMRPK